MHLLTFFSNVKHPNTSAFGDQLVVNRRDVKLAVHSLVLGDHLVSGFHKIPTSPKVIDAHRRLIRNHLLLQHFRDHPALPHSTVRPLRMIGPERHDQSVQILLLLRGQIGIDVYVHKLITIGHHQRTVVINQIPSQQHRAGRPFGDSIHRHHRTARDQGLQSLINRIFANMILQYDKCVMTSNGLKKVSGTLWHRSLRRNLRCL